MTNFSRAKKIFIPTTVFIGLVASLELFCNLQINEGNLFYFNSQINSTYYAQKNTRDLAPNPEKVKYGIFPISPPITLQTNYPPLLLSLNYASSGSLDTTYSHIQSLPFAIQTKNARHRHIDPVFGYVYDLEYSIDDKFRRVTIPGPYTNKADHFVIFAGCSIAYGAALKDADTIASVFNQNAQHTQAYNYGMRGASPGDILLRLRSIKLEDDINQRTGTVIYIYIDDHLARMINDINVVGTWGSKSSYYTYLADGNVNYIGTYEDTFPARTFIYKLLFKSNIFRYFFLGNLHSVQARDFERLSLIIKQMRKFAIEDLQAKNFYVMFFPGSKTARYLARYLEKEEISYIDFSNWDLFALTKGKSIVNFDGHPSLETNIVLSESLRQIIEK